ncbi:hypothetical protein [Spiroplasma endosymbiont of Amphibalanus improvisus]|uniref:hypothetical protein n=1 Tax=Spiroplasma endosymbiont of Amphibalanus improvisus TaxID=3066327 RepID=UPI00313DFFA4
MILLDEIKTNNINELEDLYDNDPKNNGLEEEHIELSEDDFEEYTVEEDNFDDQVELEDLVKEYNELNGATNSKDNCECTEDEETTSSDLTDEVVRLSKEVSDLEEEIENANNNSEKVELYDLEVADQAKQKPVLYGGLNYDHAVVNYDGPISPEETIIQFEEILDGKHKNVQYLINRITNIGKQNK